jgi:hypothetical protein
MRLRPPLDSKALTTSKTPANRGALLLETLTGLPPGLGEARHSPPRARRSRRRAHRSGLGQDSPDSGRLTRDRATRSSAPAIVSAHRPRVGRDQALGLRRYITLDGPGALTGCRGRPPGAFVGPAPPRGRCRRVRTGCAETRRVHRAASTALSPSRSKSRAPGTRGMAVAARAFRRWLDG